MSAADCLKLTYRLSELPTAQHKAGLAGLVLQIRNMQEREQDFEPDQLPVLEQVTADLVCLSLTELSCQTLFDELYSARKEEAKVKSKWGAKAKVLREPEICEVEDPKSGKISKVTYYYYEVVAPRNPFLSKHLSEELWQKLWRDMLYNIPRSQSTTRRPYNERAENQSCSEGQKIWKELTLWEKARRKGTMRTSSVSGALLLGAQDMNAEQVPFAVPSDQALILHFWPLCVLVYVPFQLNVDNAEPKNSRDEAVGYSLAIPEVCNIERFCHVYPRVLEEISAQTEKRGYRPRSACIDVAAQSALELLQQQAWLVEENVQSVSQLTRCFRSVEYQHLAKFGNNVKSVGSGRIVPNEDLLTEYSRIKKSYFNPLFRQGMLSAVLNESGRPWYEPFATFYEKLPHDLLLCTSETPFVMRNFAGDVRRRFRNLQQQLQERDHMSEQEVNDGRLAELVLRMVRSYVRNKAEHRSNISWDDFKDKKVTDEKGNTRMDIPKPFRDEQQHIAQKVFLEIRSRHGEDFSRYFADCFGSVSQAIGRTEDFQIITGEVLNNPDKVRILTLLALSACL